jgi:hypothetical protein
MLTDIVAILPFVLSLFLSTTTTKTTVTPTDTLCLSVFRLFRMFSLLHFFIRSKVLAMYFDAFQHALQKSKMTLILIACFQGILIIVFATLLYLTERGEWDDAEGTFVDPNTRKQSHFCSIPSACWFVAEVITTVGLGEVYPQTWVGKLLTFPLMLFGLLVIVMPSIVIGQNFSEAWAMLMEGASEGAHGDQKGRERLERQQMLDMDRARKTGAVDIANSLSLTEQRALYEMLARLTTGPSPSGGGNSNQ